MMTLKTVHWAIKMPSKDDIETKESSFVSSDSTVNIKQENESVTTNWYLGADIIGKGSEYEYNDRTLTNFKI